MLFLRRILSCCLIAICIIVPSCISNPVSAELIQGPISTLNALTTNLIFIHSDFASKITMASNNASLSQDILSTATNLENNVFTLAQGWKNQIEPNFQARKTKILEYNKTTFDNKLKNIQDKINQNPTAKESIRTDLMSLKSDITEFKDNFAVLITQIQGFKQSVAQDSQQLKTINSQIKTTIDGYELIGATQKSIPAWVLYNHINTILNNTAPEPGKYFEPLSMLNSLENLNTTWNELDSTLSNLVDEVDRASQLSATFMNLRLQAVQTLWKSEIIDTLNSAH